MIKKLWVTLSSDIWATIAFVFATWALVDIYRVGEWGWFAFFIFMLPFYIHRLALTSSAYDSLKRKGKV